MVTVDDQHRVLLIWRHRFVTGTYAWEIPQGSIRPGGDHSPLSTRLRIVPATENRADGRLLGNIVSSEGCVTAGATYSANTVLNGHEVWRQLLSNGLPFLTVPLVDAAENVNNKSFYVC